MSNSESVTRWINELKTGDDDAARQIWSRYVAKLIRIAHQRLQSSPRRAADEEDVVVRAFTAFFKGAENQRFSRLLDRDDLWQILVMLTERQVIDQQRAETAQKRGGGKTRGDSVFAFARNKDAGFEQWEDASPTPAFSMQATEQLRLRLSELGDSKLELVALRKLEGYTNREIADELGQAICTVERKLKTIRGIWSEHNPHRQP